MTDALAILALTAASHAALGVAVWRSSRRVQQTVRSHAWRLLLVLGPSVTAS